MVLFGIFYTIFLPGFLRLKYMMTLTGRFAEMTDIFHWQQEIGFWFVCISTIWSLWTIKYNGTHSQMIRVMLVKNTSAYSDLKWRNTKTLSCNKRYSLCERIATTPLKWARIMLHQFCHLNTLSLSLVSLLYHIILMAIISTYYRKLSIPTMALFRLALKIIFSQQR